jgi:hypothetical protein
MVTIKAGHSFSMKPKGSSLKRASRKTPISGIHTAEITETEFVLHSPGRTHGVGMMKPCHLTRSRFALGYTQPHGLAKVLLRLTMEC